MQAKYYDPLFYICSKKMPFTIRIEIAMKEKIEGKSLQYAVDNAIKRFPYFRVKVIKKGGEYLTEFNGKPIKVFNTKKVYALGSKKANKQMLYLTFNKKQFNIFYSHVLTDGGGFYPFVNTLLYYYCSDRYKIKLDSTGIELADNPIYDDETSNPFPEELIKDAKPFYQKKCSDYFKFTDGGYVKKKEKGKIYRIRIPESEMMKVSMDNDGSPNALISVLMSKAIWNIHKDLNKSIVSAVSFNLRAGLKNKHNYRLLSSAIFLEYPAKLKDYDILKLCTMSRGMTSIQTQAENVLYYAKTRKELVEKIDEIPTLKEKKKIVGEMALKDCTDNTFSVSYVGKVKFGEMEKYIMAMNNITDGSTYKTVFIEIASVNGFFDIAFIQGFSTDVYYKAFLDELKNSGISYKEIRETPLNTPKIKLP